jgi:hypothetical protein
MASADGSNISGRGMGMPYGPLNTISLRLHLCHIPLCIGANEPVLEYCRSSHLRRARRPASVFKNSGVHTVLVDISQPLEIFCDF